MCIFLKLWSMAWGIICLCAVLSADIQENTGRIDISYPIASGASIEQAKELWLDACKKDYPGIDLTEADIIHYVVGVDVKGQKTLTVSLTQEQIISKKTFTTSFHAWIGTVGCDDASLVRLKNIIGPHIAVEKMPDNIPFSDNIHTETLWKDKHAAYPEVPFYYVQCVDGGLSWQSLNTPAAMCGWDAECFPLKQENRNSVSENITVLIPLYHGRKAANALIALHNVSGIKSVEIVGARMGTYTFAIQLEGIRPEDVHLWTHVREIDKSVFEVQWVDSDTETARG